MIKFCDAANKLDKARHSLLVSAGDYLPGFLLEGLQTSAESLETAKTKLQRILANTVREDINNILALRDCIDCIGAIDKMICRLVRTSETFTARAPRSTVASKVDYLKRIFSDMPASVAAHLSERHYMAPTSIPDNKDAIATTVKYGYKPLIDLSRSINDLDEYGFLDCILEAFVSPECEKDIADATAKAMSSLQDIRVAMKAAMEGEKHENHD